MKTILGIILVVPGSLLLLLGAILLLRDAFIKTLEDPKPLIVALLVAVFALVGLMLIIG